jgi:hypothetical protein
MNKIFYGFSKLLDPSQKELRIYLHRSPRKEISFHNHALSLTSRFLVLREGPREDLGARNRVLGHGGGGLAGNSMAPVVLSVAKAVGLDHKLT